MKKVVLLLVAVHLLMLSGCKNSNYDTLNKEDGNQVRIDDVQVPKEVLQWLMDSDLLEYPDDAEVLMTLSQLESALYMVSTYDSDILCSKLPNGYYIYYRCHIEMDTNETPLCRIDSISISESTLEKAIIGSTRENFPELAKKIENALHATECLDQFDVDQGDCIDIRVDYNDSD